MMRKERRAAEIVIAGAMFAIVSAVPGCGSSEVGKVKVAAPAQPAPPPGATTDPTKAQSIVKSPNAVENARSIKNRPAQ